MTMAQTPLLGEENTPIHSGPAGGTGFEGATPRHQVAFTPNPLATPMHAGGLGPGATPRSEAGVSSSNKRALKAGFMNLPKPENNFELLVPEDEEEENAEELSMIDIRSRVLTAGVTEAQLMETILEVCELFDRCVDVGVLILSAVRGT